MLMPSKGMSTANNKGSLGSGIAKSANPTGQSPGCQTVADAGEAGTV